MAARHPRVTGAFPFQIRRRHRAPGAPAVASAPARPGEFDPSAVLQHHGYRGALLVVALMAALAGVVWGASAEALSAAGGALDWLERHDTSRGRAVATVLATAAGAMALIGAWARETAERRPVRLAGGRARMAVDEVAAVLRGAILDDAGVADAAVRVQNLHRRGLRVTVRAEVHPRARIDDTVDAVEAVVREIVGQRLGARLAARPAVDVWYQELDLRLGRGT